MRVKVDVDRVSTLAVDAGVNSGRECKKNGESPDVNKLASKRQIPELFDLKLSARLLTGMLSHAHELIEFDQC